jgi:hypothetical protein
MKRSVHYYFRKTHRYFGAIIGIQFLFWTLGGLFFTWSNMDQIHSDTYKSKPNYFDNTLNIVSPQIIINELNNKYSNYEIKKLELINFLDIPLYRLLISNSENNISEYILADATSGKIRSELSKEESINLAKNAFSPNAPVKEINYLTVDNIGKHHEYRGGILPAYAVSFDHSSGVTIFVSPEMAQVVTFRNSNWRVFDFLWMMHTMDYSGRDNLGNYLLRIFAILGLATILSGFILYYFSSRNIFRKSKK